MKVAVTGGTGFVGKSIVNDLVGHGHEVRVLSRKNPGNLPDNTVHYKGSVITGEGLDALVKGADAVIHLVGIIRENGKNTFEAVHHYGTVNILRSSLNAGVARYLHMSAMGTREGATSVYHRTKWAGEIAVRASGLDWTIFRPSIIFGPEDAFVNMLSDIMKWTPVMPVIGGGKSLMQPVHINDVAAAFRTSLEPGKYEGKTYEVGGPQVFSLMEIIKIIAKVIDKKRLYLNIPFFLLKPVAKMGDLLRLPVPVNSDQIIMLGEDNVRTGGDPLDELGIEWMTFEEGIRQYLVPGT